MNIKKLPRPVEINKLETPRGQDAKPGMKISRRFGLDRARCLSAALLALGASGCGAPGDKSEDQQVGSSSQAVSDFDTYAVGVMPLDAGACPADRLISIYTDDEDDNNESDSTGWDAPGTARRARKHNTGRHGTNWTFCKVDGRDFKSLTKFAANTHYFYAVLSLGDLCPNGSIFASRIMMGELDNNESAIVPVGLAKPGNYQNGTSTIMSWCMFGPSTDKMTSFPDLGMRYAVFHDYDAAQPSLFIQKRWVYSDNEDAAEAGSTRTFLYFSDDYRATFDAIVSGDPNTMFDIARVR